MLNEITFIFEGNIEHFTSVGTIKFEYISGLKNESIHCILVYNKLGERRIIDTTTIISIVPINN